jgi:hypothetical protein
MDRETGTRNADKIKSLGCTSIHIGGGKPFLNLEGHPLVLLKYLM